MMHDALIHRKNDAGMWFPQIFNFTEVNTIRVLSESGENKIVHRNLAELKTASTVVNYTKWMVLEAKTSYCITTR